MKMTSSHIFLSGSDLSQIPGLFQVYVVFSSCIHSSMIRIMSPLIQAEMSRLPGESAQINPGPMFCIDTGHASDCPQVLKSQLQMLTREPQDA